jgi:hypothetical protein
LLQVKWSVSAGAATVAPTCSSVVLPPPPMRACATYFDWN